MKYIKVEGPTPLKGRVRVAGAKNSVLKLMAATLLAEGTSTLHNVPDILDVRIMSELLRRLGCVVEHDHDAGVLRIEVPESPGVRADYELVRAMRASICVLGPLVARCGEAHVALPGGDAIGSRGLDMHQQGLEELGAQVHIEHGYFIAEAPRGLSHADIRLDFPSVGATENLLMAATLTQGTTVIDNVAREPEIIDICRLLIDMGADITGVGTSRLEITGADELHPAEHDVVGDRIVAGSWAFGAVMTSGDVVVEGIDPAYLRAVLDKLECAGATIERDESSFRVRGPQRPVGIRVSTLPYPGFPTDLQPFVVALNALADGTGMITENLFEGRWRFVQELTRLGARVRVDGHHALVIGVESLSGAPVEASDIRAGAALVMAGLAADGVTEVTGVEHIDRGYESFVRHLTELGAVVERGESPDPVDAVLG